MNNAQNAQQPGWYPDPTLPGQQRWWSGLEWTDFTRSPEAAQPAAASYSPHAVAADAYAINHAAPPTTPAAERSILDGNGTSLTAIAVSAAYLFVAYEYSFYLTGFIPAAIAYEAFRERERLAPIAVLVAGVALALGLARLLS